MICARAGKESYEGAGEARAALRARKRQDGGGGNGVVAYSCKWCGGWHLGHPKNSPKERAVNALRRYRITHLRRPGAET